jgi:hypothetical protein
MIDAKAKQMPWSEPGFYTIKLIRLTDKKFRAELTERFDYAHH